ncbi:HTH ArsR-type DNA-binding domain containing protein [uncultured Caudovirales phage]|uniref:HTH ArsR-type DNA-binding domain containing protein n=1 Tax=uncultured Caudovirales phage TaxID=2100421 RepID=A0A6J7VKU9_9CAUD|nr:HTH ArsR-type DNA-binding domain containing protein [uncultured Caudovirales phage]
MTETQKAILEKLLDEELTIGDLSTELHMGASNLRKVLHNMVKSKYIKLEGSFYSIEMNYNPPLAWNFKPLLGVWK